nr:predicted GPI-anchored protein 58 [Lolium perenne]
MDATSGTPPYSIPPTAAAASIVAPPHVPNPSGGADAGNTAARAIFVLSRPTLHTSAVSAQAAAAQAPGKARPLPNRKVPAAKRPSPVAGANKPPPKKGMASSTRRVKSTPPAPSMNHPPPSADPSAASADPSGAHMVFDEVPERVDEAAFMEAMNVGSSFVNDDIVEENE